MAALCLLFFTTLATALLPGATAGAWCVARNDASEKALQSALDYACSAGADCTPILPNGLCFLPNTLLAHASYAFNSYFHRRSTASSACDFSGAAVLAKTDPSYGSCVYPSSASTAGGATAPSSTNGSTTSTAPMPTTLTPANGDGTAGLNPGEPPSLPNEASLGLMAATFLRLLSHALVFVFASPLLC